MFEWIADPTLWAGLLALILLEIVLGIDNLVFIAVLAEKLPPNQRDKARILGLSLALVMRLGLLFSIAWLVTLTQPLFYLIEHPVSGRDLILFSGGLFLLYKATTELHGRLEGKPEHMSSAKVVYASFAVVVTQIVVLDAVFSIDSVITAIGMTEELGIMMVAMIIAMLVMLVSSKWLTNFVNAHPTLIILCLAFLLMIGFSLVAEGLGFHIPKGYLYAAIGFSILIEVFNQLAQFNKEKWLRRGSIRERAIDNIFRMLGSGGSSPETAPADTTLTEQEPAEEVFKANERDMIRGVLALADTNIKALMTPRRDIHLLDISSPLEQQRQSLLETNYSRLVVIRDGQQDEPLGLVQKKNLLDALLRGEELDIERHLEQPAVLLETQDAIQTLEVFRREGRQLAFVVDEFGTLEGIVTLTDLMEAIAGDMLDIEEPSEPYVLPLEQGGYLVDASKSLNDINRHLPTPLPKGQDYTTLAGLILHHLEHMPVENEELHIEDWQLRVAEMDTTRITKVELTKLEPEEAEQLTEAET